MSRVKSPALFTSTKGKQKMKISRLLAMLLMLACSSLIYADTVPLKKSEGILVTADGMTVYTFAKDTSGSGKSVCNGGCAPNWPPVPRSEEHPSELQSIMRLSYAVFCMHTHNNL